MIKMMKSNIFRSSKALWIGLTLLSVGLARGFADQVEFWGAPSNGLQAGLWYRAVTKVGSVEVIPELKWGSPSDPPGMFLQLYVPPRTNRYRMDLFDEKGNPVAKTRAGQALGRPAKPQRYKVDFQHGYTFCGVGGGLAEPVGDSLRLSDYFAITRPGHYRLELRVGVVWQLRPGVKPHDPPLFEFLPPVHAEFDIKLKTRQ